MFNADVHWFHYQFCRLKFIRDRGSLQHYSARTQMVCLYFDGFILTYVYWYWHANYVWPVLIQRINFMKRPCS